MSTHNICFFLRNKKNIHTFGMKRVPYLELNCARDTIMGHENFSKKSSKVWAKALIAPPI